MKIYAENVSLLLSHKHTTSLDLESKIQLRKKYRFW